MSESSKRELGFLKLLYSIDGIGPQKVFSLLSKYHSFENIFSANYSSLIDVEGINKILAGKILSSEARLNSSLENLDKELESVEKIGARLITFWDNDYPELLKNIYFSPLILYIKGSHEVLKTDSIAIVGTREPTNYGKSVAEKFAQELAMNNLTIVSGLARGIDSIAHSATIKKSGKTIAVIGCGLDFIYPPENKKLYEEISNNGCIVSEYELGTKPDAQNFPRRNRIISGLSHGTLIVETKINGGAMQTAAYALDQGREVFAVPGPINSKQSDGPNSLIKKSEAKLVINAEDIISELRFISNVKKDNAKPTFVELNLFEEKIYNVLSTEPLQIDEISSQSSLNTSDCLVHLLTLEFKGLIRQLPGKMFVRI